MASNKEIFNSIVHEMKYQSGHIAHLKQVIREDVEEYGFNINTKGLKGRTLAHYVVKYDIAGMVSFLNKLGLNLNVCDDVYDSPLHKAIKLNRYTLTKELIACEDVDMNIPGEFEQTPLHIAVGENNYELAKLLVTSGADVSIVDEKNNSPLDYALDDNNLEIIELLKNKK